MTDVLPGRLDQIVVAVDGSPESQHALELAAQIGAPHQATLTLVHVRPRHFAIGLAPDAFVELTQAEVDLEAVIRSEAAGRLADYPGRWDLVIRTGHVTHELLAAADEVDAGLIALGHRSHGPIRDAILGSVAASVVHHSRRSVLVAVPRRA